MTSTALRARRAQGIEAVIPVRARCTQSRDPGRYKARNAVERGLGGLPRGRRATTRDAPYAHRGLGFLYLAAAWIGLN